MTVVSTARTIETRGDEESAPIPERREPVSLGLAPAPSLRPSLLVVLLVDVMLLGMWASWTAVGSRGSRALLLSAWLCAPFVVTLLTRPMARHLAFRGMRWGSRAPWAVVVSVALASALAVMSIVALDALSHAASTTAREQLGPIDELIVAPRAEARTAAQAAIAAAMIDDDAVGRATTLGAVIDGQLALTTLRVRASAGTGSVVAPGVGGVAIEATAIEIDVPTVQRFGQSGSSGQGSDTTGFADRQPLRAGHVLLGRDLAHDLGAAAGDDVVLTIADTPTSMRVDGVLPRLGVAGLSVDGSPHARVAFVAPGLLTAAAAEDRGPSYLLAISNTGNAERGGGLGDLVTGRLEALFQGAVAPDPVATGSVESTSGVTPRRPATIGGVTVVPVKRDLQRRTEREVAPLRQLFTSLGTVAVAVSGFFLALLLTQVVTRRRRAIVAVRLIGVGRIDVAGAVAVEAWMAAIVGVLCGSTLGYALSIVLARANAAQASSRGVGLVFDASVSSAVVGGSVALAFAIGAIAVPLLMVANRPLMVDLQDTPRRTPKASRWSTVAFAVSMILGPVVLLRGVRNARTVDTFAAAAFIAIVVISWVRHRRPQATALVTGVTSSLLLAGEVLARWVRPALVSEAGTAGFVAQTIVAIVAAGLLTESLARPVGGAIGRLRRRLGERNGSQSGQLLVAGRLGVTARRHEPIRALLSAIGFTAMFFLLAASWSLSSSLESRVMADVAAARGGWDAIAHADEASLTALRGLPGVTAVADFRSRPLMIGAADARATASAIGLGIGTDYGLDRPASLALRRITDDSDRRVYEAVLRDPTLAIVDPVAFPRGASTRDVQPGDTVFARDPQSGGSAAFTVAGTLRSGVGLAPILMNRAALDRLGSGPAVTDRAVVRFASGAAATVAGRSGFSGSLRTFDAAARDETAAPRQLLGLLRAFTVLSIVLCVGVLSAAAAEQIRRRQRELATLRSLGLRHRGLRTAVLQPALVQMAEAALLGSALGVLGAANLLRTGVLGPARLDVPWLTLIVSVAGAVAVALAAAWRPAAGASAIAPMRAMR